MTAICVHCVMAENKVAESNEVFNWIFVLFEQDFIRLSSVSGQAFFTSHNWCTEYSQFADICGCSLRRFATLGIQIIFNYHNRVKQMIMLSNQLSEGIREWTVDVICPAQSLIKLGVRLWKWEIWGSHDYADEDSRLLEYDAVSI